MRQYLAVVRGRVEEREGTLVHHLRRTGIFQKVSRETGPRSGAGGTLLQHRTAFASRHPGACPAGDRPAESDSRAIRRRPAIPVIGDRKYRAEEAEETRIARVALHAAFLEFIHPVTRETVPVESKLPGDMKSLITSLRR